MSKREHITIIKPWQVTAGEHTGKWLAGVQWTEGSEQKDRQIDCPRSTFHEAQRDADALSRKIEAEGMQGDYPPLVTTQAREKADAADASRWSDLRLASPKAGPQLLGGEATLTKPTEIASFTLIPTPPSDIADGTLWRDITGTFNCTCNGKTFLGADASDAIAKAIKHARAVAADVRVKSLTAEIASAIQIISDCGIDASGGMLFTVRSMAEELKREKKRLGDALHEAIGHRNAAEQQISDAIEVLHAHGIPVEDGMIASVTTLAKAWRLLSETHNATVREAMEAQAKAEKEAEEAQRTLHDAGVNGPKRNDIKAWSEAAAFTINDMRGCIDGLARRTTDLETNLDMARKNLSAACEQREEAMAKSRSGISEDDIREIGRNLSPGRCIVKPSALAHRSSLVRREFDYSRAAHHNIASVLGVGRPQRANLEHDHDMERDCIEAIRGLNEERDKFAVQIARMVSKS